MKLKSLLIFFALLLVSGSAKAEIVDGVRQKPVFTPNPQELQFDQAYYFYNTGSKMFWCGGNDWGTRASVGEKGWKVKFSQHLVDGAWDEKTVVMTDSVEAGNSKGKWLKCWFTTDAVGSAGFGSIYTDYNNQPDWLWTISNTGKDYRLQVNDLNTFANFTNFQSDMYVGVNDTLDGGGNTRVWANLFAGTSAHFIDWQLITVEDYNAYLASIDIYNKAQELKSLLDEAKSKGLDVSSQQSVYENETSTMEELDGAIDMLHKLIASLDEFSASADNPMDKTSMIANASYDNNNNDGWSGTAPAFQSYTDAEHYQKTYDTYQDIEGLPNGVYMLTLQAFYRAGFSDVSYNNFISNTNKNASIYAKSGEDSITLAIMNPYVGAETSAYGVGSESSYKTADGITYYIPNDMNSAANYFVAGRFLNKMFFSVEGNKTRIGLAKKVTLDGDWTLWDNWTLTYYGSKEDAFKVWMQEVLAQAPNYDNLPEGTLVTNGVVDTYKAAVEAVSGAVTKADILAGKAAIDTAAAVVDKNIAAWKALVVAKAYAEETAADQSLVDTPEGLIANLADYVEFDLADIVAALELSTEEVEAETKKINEWVAEIKRVCLPIGYDVTSDYLVNADFSQGTTGWSGSWTAVASGCMEAYARDWDAYQIVKDAPVGVYEVSLQGFYRVARGTTAWTMWANGEQKCPGHVYVNNNETEVPCVFSEPVSSVENIYSGSTSGAEGNFCQFETATPGDSVCFPNDMGSAGEAFAKGMYKASAFGLVAKQGDELRLGVKGKFQDATWVIWDNFKMVYQGYKADIIKPELQKAVDNAQANQTKAMGKTVKENLLDCIIKGTAAIALADGKVMFDALVALYSANDSVTVSVELFEKLSTAANEMYQATQTSAASQDVINAAGTLYVEIVGGIDEGTYENADIEALLAKIAEMTTMLKIPVGEASETSPLDLTSVIVNPSFEKDGANSIDGWSGASGYNFGNDDTQKGALLVEFYEKTFDMYQDIVGLPNGIYEVGVYAFDRFGNTEDDYAKFCADSVLNEAWLYALPGGDSAQIATSYLAHHSAYAGEDKGYTGTTSFINKDGVTVFVPNDMVSAKNYFANEGLYYNKVRVKVTNGKLRIGINKPTKVTGSWVIMDNWQLKYYGEAVSENDFVINDVSARAGQTISFPVALNNNIETAAFQCEVYLPKGVTLLTKKGKYDITLDDVRKDDHTVTSALQEDGSVKVIVASLTNTPFEGNSGNLFYLNLSVAEGLSGSLPIEIKGIHISDSKGNRTDLSDVSANLNVVAYTPGDVNNDGMVVVDDVVNAINYVLGTTPENFVFAAADMNDDKQILVDDVVQIINTILGISSAKEPEVASLELVADGVTTGDKFYLNDFEIKPGESKEIAIQFETENVSASDASQQMYVAFQFDIYLPKGLTVAQKKGKYNFALNEDRKDDHTISSAMQEDGAIRVLGASLTNSYFWEKKGDFVVFTVTASDDFVGTHEISLKKVMFTENSGKRTDLADVTSKVSDGDVNGIEGVVADGNKTFKVYTIDGKQTVKSDVRKGVYIINGKKMIVK